jgi:hypothetical protein
MKNSLFLLLFLLLIGVLMAVESDPSHVVGYVKYHCVSTPTNGLNFIALPMEQGYTMVSDFANDYPGMMDNISYWDAPTQSWASAIDLGYWEGDFPIHAGSVLMLYALSTFDVISIGTLPNYNATRILDPLIPGLNTVMMHEGGVTMVGEFGDLYGVVDAISYWDDELPEPSFSWVSAINLGGFWEGDFPVGFGDPLMVYALDFYP